jgi:hypothetical protein
MGAIFRYIVPEVFRGGGEEIIMTHTSMKPIVSDPQLVAYCGLYCGACRAYRSGRCPGCHANDKATWCKVRSCCIENELKTCADCLVFSNPSDCKRFNNIISKIFGLIFRSDRAACIRQIREHGVQWHADDMAERQRHTIKKS